MMAKRKTPPRARLAADSAPVATDLAPEVEAAECPATRLRAAVILEVLAGQRTAGEAAQALELSVNHYYLLERRALAGLLEACQARPRGPRPDQSLQRKIESLERELQRCQHEAQRQAALVRATQRALGLPASESLQPAAKSKGKSQGKPQRKRKRAPAVRALRAARQLRNDSPGDQDSPTTLAEQAASPVQPIVGKSATSSDHPQEADDGRT